MTRAHRFQALTALGLSLLLTPATLLAYTPPSDVFDSLEGGTVSTSDETGGVPVTKRTAAQAAADQNAKRAAEREYYGNFLKTQNNPLVVPKKIDQPTETDTGPKNILSDKYQYERRRERMQGQAGGPMIIIGGNGGRVVDGRTGVVLHSGAPGMTGSGPAETLAVFALLFAAAVTFALVLKRERQAVLLRS